MQSPEFPDHLADAQQLEIAAKRQMKRGLALLENTSAADLREAAQCFAEAIELRRRLPLETYSWWRYGLIAAWMNRADALTRLGSTDELSEALRCYDEALKQLGELPMSESPLFVRRLAIAWLNRGVTLLKQNTAASLAQAVESFRESIAAGQNFFSCEPSEDKTLLAIAWMNLGNALIQQTPPKASDALVATRKALSFCGDEKNNLVAARTGSRARHVLCQAVARLLSERDHAESQRGEWLAAATDAVDDGLALARHWAARGSEEFAEAAAELFHFGCRAFQSYQPHFLTEFLLENLDPSRQGGAFVTNLKMHSSAVDAIWRVLGRWKQHDFKSVNTPQFAELLENLRELRLTEERLAELRRGLQSDQKTT